MQVFAPPAAQPPAAQFGTVNLIFAGLPAQDVLAQIVDTAIEYRIQFFDVGGTDPTRPEVIVARAFEAEQLVTVDSVPLGPQLLLVTGLDSNGVSVGAFSQEIEVGASPLEVFVDSLYSAGPTREVGRVSVSTNGQQSTLPSDQVAISGNGRFVAFSTAQQLSSSDRNSKRDIYVRDRVNATTTRWSFAPNGTLTDPQPNLPGDCVTPDLSDSGDQMCFVSDGKVYLRSVTSRVIAGSISTTTSTSQISVTSLTVGGQSRPVTNPRNPVVSRDGRFVAYSCDFNNRENILLFDRTQKTTQLVSVESGAVTREGSFGACALSGDGRYVFYASNVFGSTTTRQLVVRDRTLATTSVVQAPLTLNSFGGLLTAVSASADGNLVLVGDDTGLRVIPRTNTANPSVVLSEAVVGRAEISGTGQFVVYQTGRSDQVSNDGNGRVDVFVANLTTGVRCRLNVAGDGFANEGGVTADRGPDISTDGSRVAFASGDSLLVPGDTNAVSDAFSAGVPRQGLLYLAFRGTTSNTGVIARLNGALSANGTPALAQVTGNLTGLNDPGKLVLDTANDRLYVANTASDNSKEILVFNNASTMTGNVAPARRIRFNQSFSREFALDFQRNLLYIETLNPHTLGRVANASTANGTVTLAAQTSLAPNLDTAPERALLVDQRRDEIYVPVETGPLDKILNVFRASTATSNSAPTRTLKYSDLPGISSLDFDISPRGTSATVNASNLVALVPAGLLPTAVLTFDGNGSGSVPLAFPPLKEITGAAAFQNNGFFPETPSATIDRTTGSIYVAQVSNGAPQPQVRVFPGNANGNVSPSRTIALSGIFTGYIALDSTR